MELPITFERSQSAGWPRYGASALLALGVLVHLLFLVWFRIGILNPLFNDSMHRFGPGCDLLSIYAAGVKARKGASVYTIGDRVDAVPYAYAFRYAPVVAYTLGLVLSILPNLAAYTLWLVICELVLLRNIGLTMAPTNELRRGAGVRLALALGLPLSLPMRELARRDRATLVAMLHAPIGDIKDRYARAMARLQGGRLGHDAAWTPKTGVRTAELLFVLAAIAIPAAILFPVFARAREKARETTCFSNLKEIGRASAMYAGDYDDGVLPWLMCGSSCGNAGISREARLWTGRIQPYLKNGGGFPAEGIFTCPSFTEQKLKDAANAVDCDGPGSLDPCFPPLELYAHYGFAYQSSSIVGSGTRADPYWQFPGSLLYPVSQGGVYRWLRDMNRPAETAMISDGITEVYSKDSLHFGITFGCEAVEMHHQGGNFVFLDGHSKYIAGNAERYLAQRSTDGAWCKRYFTFPFE